MRKYLAAALLACVVIVAPALAAPSDGEPKKACADIIDADGTYGADGSLTAVGVFLAAPSCKNVTYTLHVLDAEGTEIGSSSARGDDGTSTLQLIPSTMVTAGTTIYVYFTSTSGNGPNVLDRAPDTGTAPATLPGSSFGFAGFH
jgi:hypothetical protein